MNKIYTTEITSSELPSDNPVHQRLFKAYLLAEDFVHGDVLEVGCGEGRGMELLLSRSRTLTAIDKITGSIERLKKLYPNVRLIAGNIPPFKDLKTSAYDVLVSFQVIEHIHDDRLYIQEIFRVLKPGGIALITTPNRPMSLSRNPWHVREYTSIGLKALALSCFGHAEVKGIAGNDKVMAYYASNKKSVERIMRWDILNLQQRLPRWVLRMPYELMNRINRNRLLSSDDALVNGITAADYVLTDDAEHALDLFLIARKDD